MQERNKLEDLQNNKKDKAEQEEVAQVLEVQERLFDSYINKRNNTEEEACKTNGHDATATQLEALLVASRRGLQQLTFLLVKVAGVPVDSVVDPTTGTNALHEAASHGRTGCVVLLLSLGARPLLDERYGHTPAHLSAMFSHPQTHKHLVQSMPSEKPRCRAGTDPTDIQKNYSHYMKSYSKSKVRSRKTAKLEIINDNNKAAESLLKTIDFKTLLPNVQKLAVDYTSGEAKEVKQAVEEELKNILQMVTSVDSTYQGSVVLSGSSADSTRLFCPDEYDVNLVLDKFSDVKVEVTELEQAEASLKGHTLRIKILSQEPSLQGNKLISNLYDRVKECLGTYTLKNDRLSLVPPGVIRTQVGVGLSLAWQGREYPLLLIGVDLVPVLEVPWHDQIRRPYLTPDTCTKMHVSNTSDGSWRCSFASMEVEVLKNLEPEERWVFLACKVLLSHMKYEPWMPREVKDKFSWWDSKNWKIPIPSGFCFKNSFLKQLEKKRQRGIEWRENNMSVIMAVFRDMCEDMIDPTTQRQSLVPTKVAPYFGGECEGPKLGDSAPEILEYLKECARSMKPKTGYMGLRSGFLNYK